MRFYYSVKKLLPYRFSWLNGLVLSIELYITGTTSQAYILKPNMEVAFIYKVQANCETFCI